jgi:post-segregation antitoxin (ccd killing protein)
MKTKLTVTIDRELLPRAKRYAREKGVSLSSLIEDALRNLGEAGGTPFAERWRGRFVPADRDDERYRALADKYR